MEEHANSQEFFNEDANANSQDNTQGTQENDNSTNTTIDHVVQTVDYQKKFSESSSEALRLYQENKTLREALELKDKAQEQVVPVQNTNDFYPGFEELDEEAKNNLIAYTDTVTRRVQSDLQKDPAIAFARRQYNEQVWNSAFEKTIRDFPELAASRDEFKSKYYNVNNVPENVESILHDIAKIHLFDKAKDIGAKESEEKQNRIDTERTTAGIKDSAAKRSLEDWNRLANENPAKFAQLSKEYNSDLESGKI